MGSFPPRARFESAIRDGNARLARNGFPHRCSADELRAWLRTDTPYPNPSPADLLDSPLLVVHEIVEIEEVKRRGLRITKDVIVRNPETINDAHLVAARAELAIAAKEGDRGHVASRYVDLRGWCEDPLLTPSQRAAYNAFRDRVKAWLDAAVHGRPTEEL